MRVLGDDVRRVRSALGFTRSQFARALRASVASVHRWEAAGPSETTVRGLHEELLVALIHAEGAGVDLRVVGERVAGDLVIGGGLAALATLLQGVTRGWPS